MFLWIIQMTIISIILIFLVHHLINFFKSTLTVPKIKDLVNNPNQKYENMYNIINRSQQQQPQIVDDNDENATPIDMLPSAEPNMKDELKHFLKSQLDNNANESFSNYL